MASERCSDCGIDWPITTKECGVCLGDVSHFPYTDSITAKEAKRLIARAEFHREYEKRERGEESKCGPKRDLSLKQREQINRLVEGAREINRLERLYHS